MMKTTFQNITDQKKFPVHILIALFSLIITSVYLINNPEEESINAIHLMVLLFIEMELFIFLGAFLFTGLKPGFKRGELTKKVLERFLLFLIICFILAFIITIFYHYFTRDSGLFRVAADFMKYGFSGWFKGTVGGLMFGAAVFIFIQWQDALQREQKLREENLIFQNETLKNQVNPHFLFNSLNTLSLLITSHPEIAEKFINKLSSIYRYILEYSAIESVPLESELSFIRDYFYLHRIRGENKIYLDIKVESAEFKIMPISLQGLIENAIKHNMATKANPLKIEVYLDGTFIVVRNNLQKMATQVRSPGTGLKNLGTRITLFTGRSMVIEETEDYFLVKLPLLL